MLFLFLIVFFNCMFIFKILYYTTHFKIHIYFSVTLLVIYYRLFFFSPNDIIIDFSLVSELHKKLFFKMFEYLCLYISVSPRPNPAAFLLIYVLKFNISKTELLILKLPNQGVEIIY